MTDHTLQFGSIAGEEIDISKKELALRLKTDEGFSHGELDALEAELRKAAECRFGALRVAVSMNETQVQIGDICTESRDIRKNLKGCKEAFLFAVTLGFGTERFLDKWSRLSPAAHFMADALSSAFCEALCDAAEKEISQGLCVRPRFSPGYGDLPLEMQAPLLHQLRAKEKLGISLTEQYLMIPRKTITAIMGIVE